LRFCPVCIEWDDVYRIGEEMRSVSNLRKEKKGLGIFFVGGDQIQKWTLGLIANRVLVTVRLFSNVQILGNGGQQEMTIIPQSGD